MLSNLELVARNQTAEYMSLNSVLMRKNQKGFEPFSKVKGKLRKPY